MEYLSAIEALKHSWNYEPISHLRQVIDNPNKPWDQLTINEIESLAGLLDVTSEELLKYTDAIIV